MSDRPADSVDPKLLEILVCPLTKTPLEYDAAEAGADLAGGEARLSDPRRHPDHAARRGAAARLTFNTRRFSIVTRGLDPRVHAALPHGLPGQARQ